MRYQKSKALKSFEVEINILIKDLTLIGSNKIYNSRIKEFTICSVITLCFANIENYISDLLDSWVDLLIRSNVKFSKIPFDLRTFIFTKTQEIAFKNYLLTKDEKRLIEKVNITKAHYNILNDEGTISRMHSKIIYSDKKYPSPENIEILFNRLGIKNIFHKLNKRCKRDMRLVLASFNDTRTSIVHQGIQPGTNYKDFIKKLREISLLIKNIDFIFFQEAVKNSKNHCWEC